jgi:hypothetical protein
VLVGGEGVLGGAVVVGDVADGEDDARVDRHLLAVVLRVVGERRSGQLP